MNAFAQVSLQRIQEFHLWPLNTSTPNCPYQSLLRSPETNKTEPESYLIIPCSCIHGTIACLEHSNLLKVNGAYHTPFDVQQTRMAGTHTGTHPRLLAGDQTHHTTHPTTSFLTAANLIYAIGAGITAAAGHYETGCLLLYVQTYRHPPPTLRCSAPLVEPLAGGLARSSSCGPLPLLRTIQCTYKSRDYPQPTPFRALRRPDATPTRHEIKSHDPPSYQVVSPVSMTPPSMDEPRPHCSRPLGLRT